MSVGYMPADRTQEKASEVWYPPAFGLTAENGTDCIRPPEPPNTFPTKQGAGTRNMRFLYALE